MTSFKPSKIKELAVYLPLLISFDGALSNVWDLAVDFSKKNERFLNHILGKTKNKTNITLRGECVPFLTCLDQ